MGAEAASSLPKSIISFFSPKNQTVSRVHCLIWNADTVSRALGSILEYEKKRPNLETVEPERA